MKKISIYIATILGTFSSWLHGYIANPFLELITGYHNEPNSDNSIRVIDGHKHKRHFIQVGGINEKNLSSSSFALLGLGSASSTDLAMDERNSIGILDFNELGKVKIKIMTISNLDNQNENIAFECTLPVNSN